MKSVLMDTDLLYYLFSQIAGAELRNLTLSHFIIIKF